MFREDNKEHERVTAAAVRALQARYPHLRIEEQGCVYGDRMYSIGILFPSLPQERINVFSGDSPEAIVTYVTGRVEEMLKEAKIRFEALKRDTQPSA